MFSYVSHTSGKVSLWFQFAAEKVLFFLKSLEIGTDETIRIMPCVIMCDVSKKHPDSRRLLREGFLKGHGYLICLIGLFISPPPDVSSCVQ